MRLFGWNEKGSKIFTALKTEVNETGIQIVQSGDELRQKSGYWGEHGELGKEPVRGSNEPSFSPCFRRRTGLS